MPRILDFDNPWRRLPWSLPLALLISACVLWELGRVLERPPLRQTPPASIDAELIELPPPVEQKPEAMPQPAAQPKQPARQQAPVALPAAPASPARAEPAAAAPLAPPAPASPSVPQAPGPASAGSETSGAQAIVRTMPQIPDDLRQDAFNAVAVVRFHVAADGTASFELVRPTPNPRLNRLLLEKLREWRFFPAMRDGKPVASDQEVRITFEVK